jgi:isocitrate dehydrogenase
MATYRYATVPAQGERIEYSGGSLRVPPNPSVPFIEGDGTGPDIWRASVRVFDAAVERAFAPEAGHLIVRGLESAIKSKRVTYDLARQMPGATEISTSAFGDQVIRSMPA